VAGRDFRAALRRRRIATTWRRDLDLAFAIARADTTGTGRRFPIPWDERIGDPVASVAVRRSYDHETTKGGHADLIPLATPLRPYLAEAMLASRSEYVFPAADGSMRSEETKLQQILGRALGRAGMVQGYHHVCRRKGCEHKEKTKDRALRHCPKCNMKLWPKGIPRPMRFHDLRGTTATLLARAGVGLVVAQRILRHSDPRLTANIYSRVDLSDLQAGVDRMGIPGAAVSP
jgi:integrase